MEAFNRVFSDPVVARLALAGAGLLVLYALTKLATRWLSRHVDQPGARYRARKLIMLAAWVLGLAYVASVFSARLGSLAVAMGLVGAGIAFALQEVIMSVAGWITVSFGSIYKPGHRIRLGGVRGDVIDVSLLRTTLFQVGDWVDGDLYNGSVVRVANSFVFKEPVFNYSGDFPFLWDELKVPVRYGSDRDEAFAILDRVAQAVVGDYVPKVSETWKELTRKYMIESSQIEPMVSLVFDENWMTYTVRYVVDYKCRRSIKSELSRRILEAIADTDGRVEVASTSMEISLTGAAS
jgi:small-conductance mechanosensitive channel